MALLVGYECSDAQRATGAIIIKVTELVAGRFKSSAPRSFVQQLVQPNSI